VLLDHHLLDLGGTYGDPETGDPIQYDELRIKHDQGEVEIVVYNRAILLFRTESEAVRRIHQVCCRLDDLAAPHGRGIPLSMVKMSALAAQRGRWDARSPRTGALCGTCRPPEKPPLNGGEPMKPVRSNVLPILVCLSPTSPTWSRSCRSARSC